jgi:hypothetical protein
VSLEIRVHGSPSRCPYCKGSIGDVREIVACALCGARHHAACREEHGRCAVCSSSELLVYQAAAAKPRAEGLEVDRRDGAVIYRWRLLAKEGLELVPKTALLRLEPDTLSFTAAEGRTLYPVSAARSGVRTVARAGRRIQVLLTDGRHVVATESIGYALSDADLATLEGAIRDWHAAR